MLAHRHSRQGMARIQRQGGFTAMQRTCWMIYRPWQLDPGIPARNDRTQLNLPITKRSVNMLNSYKLKNIEIELTISTF